MKIQSDALRLNKDIFKTTDSYGFNQCHAHKDWKIQEAVKGVS